MNAGRSSQYDVSSSQIPLDRNFQPRAFVLMRTEGVLSPLPDLESADHACAAGICGSLGI